MRSLDCASLWVVGAGVAVLSSASQALQICCCYSQPIKYTYISQLQGNYQDKNNMKPLSTLLACGKQGTEEWFPTVAHTKISRIRPYILFLHSLPYTSSNLNPK